MRSISGRASNLVRKASILIIALYSAAVFGNTNVDVSIPFSKVQMEKAITLSADQLEPIKGKEFSNITVYAKQNDKLIPIPFQFEEYSDKGFLFQGPTEGVDPTEVGVFNGRDLLVFMLRDSGTKALPEDFQQLDLITQVEIRDYDTTSYIYLIRNGARSSKRYVTYNTETGLIEMPTALVHMNPKDLLDWGDIIPLGYDNDEAPSILDSIKVRISGSFMNIPLKLDNKNLQAKLKNVYEGPVRMTLDAEFRAIILKIPIVRAHAQVHMDIHSANLFVNMSTPKAYSKWLKDPRVIVAIDGNALYGGFVQTSVTGNQSYYVDGEMSEEERQLENIPIDEDVSWIWLSSKDDFNVIGQFDVMSQEVIIDPDVYTDVTVYYRDDKSLIDKPERFAGALPSLGYQMRGMPENESTAISYKVFFIDDMKPLGAGEYLKQLDSKPEIKI